MIQSSAHQASTTWPPSLRPPDVPPPSGERQVAARRQVERSLQVQEGAAASPLKASHSQRTGFDPSRVRQVRINSTTASVIVIMRETAELFCDLPFVMSQRVPVPLYCVFPLCRTSVGTFACKEIYFIDTMPTTSVQCDCCFSNSNNPNPVSDVTKGASAASLRLTQVNTGLNMMFFMGWGWKGMGLCQTIKGI